MSTATRNATYQEGCIQLVQRAKGPDVWVYRWRETNDAGRRVQRKKFVGNLKQYKNESAVKKAVENLRARSTHVRVSSAG